MGEQAQKARRAAWGVTVDFTAPKVLIGRRDRELLKADLVGGGDEDSLEVRAVKYVLSSAVVLATMQPDGRVGGLGGTDRAMMSRWQESALDVSCDRAEIDRSMLDWIWEKLISDRVLTPPGQSQWYESVKSYVRELRDQPQPEAEKDPT